MCMTEFLRVSVCVLGAHCYNMDLMGQLQAGSAVMSPLQSPPSLMPKAFCVGEVDIQDFRSVLALLCSYVADC